MSEPREKYEATKKRLLEARAASSDASRRGVECADRLEAHRQSSFLEDTRLLGESRRADKWTNELYRAANAIGVELDGIEFELIEELIALRDELKGGGK